MDKTKSKRKKDLGTNQFKPPSGKMKKQSSDSSPQTLRNTLGVQAMRAGQRGRHAPASPQVPWSQPSKRQMLWAQKIQMHSWKSWGLEDTCAPTITAARVTRA